MARIFRYSTIKGNQAFVDGKMAFEQAESTAPAAFLTDLYKFTGIDYKKFYKMDCMTKLGFLASELVMDTENKERAKTDTSVILFNSSSSLETDTNYQKTIDDPDNYFPSPSEFVYTLPNIVTGEIAIRNKIYGETSFYITERFDARQLHDIVSSAFTPGIERILTGWVEYYRDNYEAFILLVDKEDGAREPFTAENILKLYKNNCI